MTAIHLDLSWGKATREWRGLRHGCAGVVMALCCASAGFAQQASPPVSETAMQLIYGADGVAQDIPAGLAMLKDASARGDLAAQRTLGEQLIGGWVTQRDSDAGLPLLRAAAQAGDTKAQLSLGTFLLYGIGVPKDMRAARDLFEQMADRGDPTGLQLYGEALMWSLKDPNSAQTYLIRAGEMGRGAAWAILAEGAMYGYLGDGKTSRAKFDGFAKRARATGNERIEVLDATRQMWGISMRANGPATLAKLETAADAGNTEAARFLIALVRDGNGMNIRKDTPRAMEFLHRYADLLSPQEQWRFDFTIAAAKTRQLHKYPGLQDRFMAAPGPLDATFGSDLYKANPNFAIYLLQARMKQDGLYPGKLDGLAGTATVRGLSQVCRVTLDRADCAETALRPDVVGALIADRNS